jgi:hypothetical protein
MITFIFMDRRIEQAVAVAVKFDRSIDARSARMECGFFTLSKSEYYDK